MKKSSAKKPNERYQAIGVRFINSVGKIFTYRVPKRAKVRLGQELVVSNDQGTNVVIVVEIHPKDSISIPGRIQNGGQPIMIKSISKKVTPL